MATEGPREPTLTGTRTSPQDIPPLNKSQGAQTSSTPLEMSSLEAGPAAAQTEKTPPLPPAPDISPQESAPATDPILPPGPSAPIAETTSNAEHPRHTSRSYSTAIGPSSDSPVPAPPKDEAVGPTLLITLLLTSGARHPFKLDSKYLQKRNVEVAGNDPFNLSVYKLKELILREWREEWELKPVSPSYIRLISFGKLLDDKGYLKDSRFNHDAPNVVHMTIKPQDYVEEEDTKGGKAAFGAGRDGSQRSPGCRCLVM